MNRKRARGPIIYAPIFGRAKEPSALIAFGLAFINAPASVIFNFMVALFFALPARLPRSLPSSDNSTRLNRH